MGIGVSRQRRWLPAQLAINRLLPHFPPLFDLASRSQECPLDLRRFRNTRYRACKLALCRPERVLKRHIDRGKRLLMFHCRAIGGIDVLPIRRLLCRGERLVRSVDCSRVGLVRLRVRLIPGSRRTTPLVVQRRFARRRISAPDLVDAVREVLVGLLTSDAPKVFGINRQKCCVPLVLFGSSRLLRFGGTRRTQRICIPTLIRRGRMGAGNGILTGQQRVPGGRDDEQSRSAPTLGGSDLLAASFDDVVELAVESLELFRRWRHAAMLAAEREGGNRVRLTPDPIHAPGLTLTAIVLRNLTGLPLTVAGLYRQVRAASTARAS